MAPALNKHALQDNSAVEKLVLLNVARTQLSSRCAANLLTACIADLLTACIADAHQLHFSGLPCASCSIMVGDVVAFNSPMPGAAAAVMVRISHRPLLIRLKERVRSGCVGAEATPELGAGLNTLFSAAGTLPWHFRGSCLANVAAGAAQQIHAACATATVHCAGAARGSSGGGGAGGALRGVYAQLALLQGPPLSPLKLIVSCLFLASAAFSFSSLWPLFPLWGPACSLQLVAAPALVNPSIHPSIHPSIPAARAPLESALCA
jgi:hypothetical protein